MPPIISSLSTVRSSYGFGRKIIIPEIGGGGDPYFNSVSLLMYGDGANGSTTFVDSSSNNFTITPYGNAQISTTQSKFGGASMYFDGNGDYATIPVDADFEFGTGDFTIEFWIRLDSIPSLTPVINLGTGSVGGSIYTAWSIFFQSGVFSLFRYDGAETYYSFNANLSTSTWYHVAFARSGTSLRCFVDGTQVGTTQSTSLSYNKVNNDPLQIGFLRTGSGGSIYNYLPGYIDDLRITKGVARYTSNFTPPTASFSTLTPGEPYFYNTSLLLHGDGTNGSTTFVDSSSNNFTITPAGNAQISTTQSKFGGASMYFDGNGDYLSVPDDTDFVFGTGDFTIEFWIKTTDTVGGLVTRIAGGAGNWDLVLNISNVYFQNQYFAVNLYNRSATAILDGNWHHLAACRSGISHRLFFDGIQQGATVTDTTNYNGTGETRIGSDAYGDFNGYIDDLRITKGVARYTANFTPPTAAFPDA